MIHPKVNIPDDALLQPFCVVEFSPRQGWMTYPFTNRHDALAYYDSVKAFRPVLAMNHGMILADNETFDVKRAA